MDFLEDPPFPACPSFGFTSEPMYRVTVIESGGGHERRNRHWSRPLHKYTASVAPRAEEEVGEVLNFYHAVGGRATGFRFLDEVDDRSCARIATPAAIDQLLVVDNASDGTYQLTKAYSVGALTQYREIYKPIAGTILVADNGDPLTEDTDYTIDYTTGLVTMADEPLGTLTWGGRFHVPVRFDSELPVEITSRNAQRYIQSCTFVMRELRLSAVGVG